MEKKAPKTSRRGKLSQRLIKFLIQHTAISVKKKGGYIEESLKNLRGSKREIVGKRG